LIDDAENGGDVGAATGQIRTALFMQAMLRLE
jgi:hypothetical protein